MRALALLLPLLLLPRWAAALDGRQEIVVVIPDDVSAFSIGAYLEPEAVATPNIDALAAAGQLYQNATSSSMCSPTRRNIYYGSGPLLHGIGKAHAATEPRGNVWAQRTSVINAAQSKGWRAVGVGKLHAGARMVLDPASPEPTHAKAMGWDDFRAYMVGNPANVDQGTGANGNHYSWERTDWQTGGAVIETTYTTDLMTSEAVDVLQDADLRPTLLFVLYSAPHFPMNPPPGEVGSCALTQEDADESCYGPALEHIDTKLADILAELDFSEDVLILAGDNGTPATHSSEHTVCTSTNSKAHATPCGTRVPLVIRGAGVTVGTVSSVVTLTDLHDTILELTGHSRREQYGHYSESLVPCFSDPTGCMPRVNAATVRFQPNGFPLAMYSGTPYSRYQIAAETIENGTLYRVLRDWDEFPVGNDPGTYVEKLYDLGSATALPAEVANRYGQIEIASPAGDALTAQTRLIAYIDEVEAARGERYPQKLIGADLQGVTLGWTEDPEAPPAPGVAYEDSFDRADNDDLTASCDPSDDCTWTEAGSATISIASNELSGSGRGVAIHKPTNSLSHFSGAQYTGTVANRWTGPGVRSDGTSACSYQFRFNSDIDFALRSCQNYDECTTFTTMTNAQMGGSMATLDALTLGVNEGTGIDTKFTVYRSFTAAPPVDLATSDVIRTICKPGGSCDIDWDEAPDIAGCYADTGTRPTLYSGSVASPWSWDSWRGGSVDPPAPDNDNPLPDPATWASGHSAITHQSMTLNPWLATDVSGPPRYSYVCTDATPPGGACSQHDSGWVTDRPWTATGLDPLTQYTWTVQFQDSALPTSNTGTVSSSLAATTLDTPVAGSGCDCGGLCTGQTITVESPSTTHDITYNFQCSGGDCTCGQYANGDYWIEGSPTFTSMTPAASGSGSGARHGWMVNPIGKTVSFDGRIVDFDGGLMPSLPYVASSGESVVKGVSKASVNCSDGKDFNCLEFANVVTVVASVPEGNGSTAFRPPYYGSAKPTHSTTEMNLSLLPSVTPAGTSIPTLAQIAGRYRHVQLDHCCSLGPAGRQMLPNQNFDSTGWTGAAGPGKYSEYGPEIGRDAADAVLRLMLNDAEAVKTQAAINVTQAGIDYYYAVSAGKRWKAQAGLGVGRKILPVFAATLLENATMKALIASLSGRNSPGVAPPTYDAWSEDGQIYYSAAANGGSGQVLWGEHGQYWNPSVYWDYVETLDGAKQHADPHAMIDGAKPGNSPYQFCCTSKTYKDMATSMHIWPAMRTTWDNEDFFTYVDRWVSTGYWYLPDPFEDAPRGRESTAYHGTDANGGYGGSSFAGGMWTAYR